MARCLHGFDPTYTETPAERLANPLQWVHVDGTVYPYLGDPSVYSRFHDALLRENDRAELELSKRFLTQTIGTDDGANIYFPTQHEIEILRFLARQKVTQIHQKIADGINSTRKTVGIMIQVLYKQGLVICRGKRGCVSLSPAGRILVESH